MGIYLPGHFLAVTLLLLSLETVAGNVHRPSVRMQGSPAEFYCLSPTGWVHPTYWGCLLSSSHFLVKHKGHMSGCLCEVIIQCINLLRWTGKSFILNGIFTLVSQVECHRKSLIVPTNSYSQSTFKNFTLCPCLLQFCFWFFKRLNTLQIQVKSYQKFRFRGPSLDLSPLSKISGSKAGNVHF